MSNIHIPSKFGDLEIQIDDKNHEKLKNLVLCPVFDREKKKCVNIHTWSKKEKRMIPVTWIICGTGPDKIIKHRNNNILDNREENLEILDRPIKTKHTKKTKKKVLCPHCHAFFYV